MEDEDIIALYWARDERAIRETSLKYGRLCRSIAGNILASREDCEECVNDTYLALWQAIPDARPARFSAFVGKVARNTALKRCEYLSAAKRSPDALLALDELGDCVPDGKSLRLRPLLVHGCHSSVYKYLCHFYCSLSPWEHLRTSSLKMPSCSSLPQEAIISGCHCTPMMNWPSPPRLNTPQR